MTNIEKKVEEFRKELIKAYEGILHKEMLEKGNPWFEKFLTDALIEQDKISREEEVMLFMAEMQKMADRIPPNLLLNEIINYAHDRRKDLTA